MTGTGTAGSTITVLEDGDRVGTTTATLAGTWSVTLANLAEGGHVFTVRASNPAGTSSESMGRVIQIDSKAPAKPVLTSPNEWSLVNNWFTIKGTSEPGTTVELFEDGNSTGTVASITGEWSRELNGVRDGVHVYTARATDMAGNVSQLSTGYSLRVD